MRGRRIIPESGARFEKSVAYTDPLHPGCKIFRGNLTIPTRSGEKVSMHSSTRVLRTTILATVLGLAAASCGGGEWLDMGVGNCDELTNDKVISKA
jgi:hypothetical protein